MLVQDFDGYGGTLAATDPRERSIIVTRFGENAVVTLIPAPPCDTWRERLAWAWAALRGTPSVTQVFLDREDARRVAAQLVAPRR